MSASSLEGLKEMHDDATSDDDVVVLPENMASPATASSFADDNNSSSSDHTDDNDEPENETENDDDYDEVPGLQPRVVVAAASAALHGILRRASSVSQASSTNSTRSRTRVQFVSLPRAYQVDWLPSLAGVEPPVSNAIWGDDVAADSAAGTRNASLNALMQAGLLALSSLSLPRLPNFPPPTAITGGSASAPWLPPPLVADAWARYAGQTPDVGVDVEVEVDTADVGSSDDGEAIDLTDEQPLAVLASGDDNSDTDAGGQVDLQAEVTSADLDNFFDDEDDNETRQN
jgi:hypothetical protein